MSAVFVILVLSVMMLAFIVGYVDERQFINKIKTGFIYGVVAGFFTTILVIVGGAVIAWVIVLLIIGALINITSR